MSTSTLDISTMTPDQKTKEATTTKNLESLKLSDTNSTIKNKCAHCHDNAVKFHCSGCLGAPTVHGATQQTTGYCGKEYQKADWPAHRKECKNLQARKALFRAAYLLQKIWYAVRRESFDNCVVKAEEVNGELLIHEGDYVTEPTKRELGFYRDFPDHVFKNKQDADTCLNLLYCSDSLSHMYLANAWLLSGICKDIKEAQVMVRKAARKSRYAGDEWDKEFIHHILKVTLPFGETYAIDLTGAQYGWYEPIYLWSTYIKNCKPHVNIAPHGVFGERQFGSCTRTVLGSTFSTPWDDRTDMERAIPMFGECLKREFNKVFLEQVVKLYPGLELLKLGLPEFEAAEKDIITKTKQMTDHATEKIESVMHVMQSEAREANQRMRESPEVARGEILKLALPRLAAIFNGEWARDSKTGRMTSVVLKRCHEDIYYAGGYFDGTLAEQKAWGGDFSLV